MVLTCDGDWVKKCMEYRVEGRRLVGRPKRTWLESVEADMAEPEINKYSSKYYSTQQSLLSQNWTFNV